MNGVNIDLFQFEYDLTWMAFFMNADDQLYARYGGRASSSPESHLTKKSLVSVMKEVLTLHKTGRVQVDPKRSGKRKTPEDIPTMKSMMAKRKGNKCIHCHDVKVARLKNEIRLGRFGRDMIYTYPTPEALGIDLDPDEQRKVKSVTPGSITAKSGVKPTDTIESVGGKRVLTLGDFSRILETTPEKGSLAILVRRSGGVRKIDVPLSPGWRKAEDPSWRESTHVAGPGGGFWGKRVSAERKRKLGLSKDALALIVTFIWGKHAKKAGLRLNDVVLAVDDRRNDMSIRAMHAYLHMNKNYGDVIPIVVRRGGKRLELSMKLPSAPPPP